MTRTVTDASLVCAAAAPALRA